MPKNSTDIEADNVIKRYARRHEALDDFCLADFISKVVSVSKIPPIPNKEFQTLTKKLKPNVMHSVTIWKLKMMKS